MADQTQLTKTEFTDEELESMKNIIENKELISDKEKDEIKKLLVSAVRQDYELAYLFVKCFDYLNRFKDDLFDEENNFRDKVERFLDYYNKECGIKDTREIVQKVGRIDGGIGTYYLQRTLIRETEENREDYWKLIGVLTKIVGVEE